MAEVTNMLSSFGSVGDVATAENQGIRARALEVAKLGRGEAGAYVAGLGSGMLMEGLAGMAGMKTRTEKKQETIQGILEESRDLDPNDPKTLIEMSRKFLDNGLTQLSQQFAERARTLTDTLADNAVSAQNAASSAKTASTSGQIKEGTSRLVGAGEDKPGMMKTQIYSGGKWVDSVDSEGNIYLQNQFKPTAPSTFAEKQAYIVALKGQIDPATGLEYTQATLDAMTNALLGAGGVNIDFGSKDSFDDTVGTLLATKMGKEIDLAEKGPAQIDKLNTVLRLINKGDVNVGFAANLKQGFDKAFAAFGSPEAMESAKDTEFLGALLGSDVFPYIQSLGIGARGLDTPQERIFLQRVMTGEITMEGAALEQLTRLRQKYTVRAIQEYNRRISEKDENGNTYYTRWEKSSGNKLKEMEIPKMVRPNKKEYTVPILDANGIDTGETKKEVFPRINPIMEPVLGDDGQPTGEMKNSGKFVYTYRPNGPRYDERGIDVSKQYPDDIVTYVESN